MNLRTWKRIGKRVGRCNVTTRLFVRAFYEHYVGRKVAETSGRPIHRSKISERVGA